MSWLAIVLSESSKPARGTRAIASTASGTTCAPLGPASEDKIAGAAAAGLPMASSPESRFARHSSGSVPSRPNFGLVHKSVKVRIRDGAWAVAYCAIIPPKLMPTRSTGSFGLTASMKSTAASA